ncbi:MAG: S8 family serine peptidase [Flavobacteriales bacterium]|nr:S8 family serine peptidase [Flavobacteriales bacterium]MBK6944661.1 S8 family serine peptidase [Flavobacteriales bacterium]MBK7241191.1 S8 family serine peptidase [Flavobacteriales bacterium]MBK9534316.1 S8 family serine peptidase [Flavobacteriales bacterium]MBP9137262.1 S8 family serine peptidase [Flavobacteriales bacterium]
MKQFFAFALIVLSFLVPNSARSQGPSIVPGDIMIMLTPGANVNQIVTDLEAIKGIPTGLRVEGIISEPMRAWLLHFDAVDIDQNLMLRELRRHPLVQLAQNNHVVKDRIVPNDTQYAQQWHHQNIDSETAWDISTGGVTATGDTIVVCIIEDADLPHADLIGNAWFNHAEIPNNSIDDDGNGYVDDFRGWNTPGGNDDVYGGGHGTQVAGMIGASGNNSIGVAGANWNVKMMVVDYGGVQEAAVVAAYTYPWVMRRRYNQSNGAEGAFVVATNASWGVDGGDPADAPLWCAIYDSLGAQGVLNCGATSNSNVNIDVIGDLPTACASDFMISVTATNASDNRTFSGYGLTTIDVGAPGEDVRTTSQGDGYGSTSGTSFASPLTAGVIGLLYSAPCSSLMSLVSGDPEAGALYIRQVLFDGTEQVGNLAGQTVTGGRISAGNSIQLIMNGCGTCPSPYNLAAANPLIGEATMSWSSTAGTVFDLQYRPVGTPTWELVSGLTSPQYTASDILACIQYEFQVRVDCGSEMSEFSSSYVFLSEGCCSVPSSLALTSTTANSAVVSWPGVAAAVTYDLQYALQGTTDWTIVPGLTTTPYTLPGLDGCTPYQVQIRSTCSGEQSDWSDALLFTTADCGDCVDLSYCPSAGGTDEEFIESVAVGGISNTSGNDGGYGDFSGQSTPMYIGQTYSITLTPGYSGFQYGEWFSVYMDFNADGIFNVLERVYNATATTTAAITGDITIPLTALPGIVRMRVIMQYQSEIASGCEATFEFGEVEDYCVLLTGDVGVDQIAEGTTINVFPAPADAEVIFELGSEQDLKDLILSIHDASGRKVADQRVRTGRNACRTAAFANGTYTYLIGNSDTELARGKLVVVH